MAGAQRVEIRGICLTSGRKACWYDDDDDKQTNVKKIIWWHDGEFIFVV